MTDPNYIEVLREQLRIEQEYHDSLPPEMRTDSAQVIAALDAAITALSARASAGEGGLLEAGRLLDNAMDTQEKRETGEFHLSAQAMRAMWNEARMKWARAAALTATPQPAQTQGEWQPTPCPTCGAFCGDHGQTCADAAAAQSEWVRVPREATMEMFNAWHSVQGSWWSSYGEMLAAAPQPQPETFKSAGESCKSVEASQPQASHEWPECSGDPMACPENEGFGCCKAVSEITPPAHGDGEWPFDAEVERLRAELDFMTAHYERQTAYMVNHRGALIYASSGMRDAYSEEHERAEAAERAREATLTELRNVSRYLDPRQYGEACNRIAAFLAASGGDQQ